MPSTKIVCTIGPASRSEAVLERLMLAGIVNEVGVGWQLVGVVLSGLRRPIEQRLQTLRFPVIGHIVGNDAARRAVYLRDEVDALFFCPAKV